MEPSDHLLVLAHSVTTYASITEQLDQSETLTGRSNYTLSGLVLRGLRDAAAEWWTTTHDVAVWSNDDIAVAIHEAADWTSAHRVRLAELIDEGVARDN